MKQGVDSMIRILFVDDEVSVLQAMQRSLHGMRNEWSMTFASSGAAALEELAKRPADVIVSDMRMPGMDGWQLLEHVKALHPQMVRLVLSGHADPGSIMRSIGVAHQYLAKPCESAVLKAAISRTHSLKNMLSSPRLARLVGGVGMLPSAPKAFQEILACLKEPKASVAQAAQIIGQDAAMTANVIKLVNSAFFGSRQPITTVNRAIAYLGLDTLGSLVLGYSVFSGGAKNTIPGFNLERVWQHSLDVAVTARTVALFEKFPPAKVEEGFLAGMLHDVGKVVYATLPGATSDAAAVSLDETIEQIKAHHAEIGAYLLGLWGFPISIVEAVGFHHAPSEAVGEGLTLPKLIHIADRLVHERHAQGADNDRTLEPDLLETLGLEKHWAGWMSTLDSLDAAGIAP